MFGRLAEWQIDLYLSGFIICSIMSLFLGIATAQYFRDISDMRPRSRSRFRRF